MAMGYVSMNRLDENTIVTLSLQRSVGAHWAGRGLQKL